MPLSITGLYAGILGLIMLFLAMRVSGERMKQLASIGTNDSPLLLEAVRRHGNFVEWVPVALILMGICEINGMELRLLHGTGVVLVAARLIHPWGIKHDVVPHPMRAIGAGLTFLVVAGFSLTAIWQWASA